MKKATSIKDGILANVEADIDGCWRWKRAKQSAGYGVTWVADELVYVHRLSYEVWVGPIPDGLEIDHLCRVRDCCNPAHLEAVTARVNSLRSSSPTAINAIKTQCPQGHPYDDANTWRDPATGWRRCRECNRANSRTRHRAKMRGRST